MLRNWKTTSAGITAIAGGLIGMFYAIKAKNVTPEILTGAITAILTGIGLIFAKDSNVTGGNTQQ
jgi:hypothetical protein